MTGATARCLAAVFSSRRRQGPILLIALVLAGGLLSARPARADSTWTGTGTATNQVVSDGTSGVAEFQYAVSVFCCASGAWTFSATSSASRSVALAWTYTGYHAFFQVTAGLSAFVTHAGVTTTTSLVNAGPVNCCTPPSGGFSYTGTTTLTVAAGDTYGFSLSGGNGDSDGRLNGTLSVVLPAEPRSTRGAYCAAAGNTNPFTGVPLVAGSFLDLVEGQATDDPSYRGATRSIFVQGKGLTCDPPPAGYIQDGVAGDAQNVSSGIYPYYRPRA